MGTWLKKRELAWLTASLLERDRWYSSSEIDGLIRNEIKPEILVDALAVDHIRAAMIEHGFAERDAATHSKYRIVAGFQLPEENEALRLTLLNSALAAQEAGEPLECPVCGRAILTEWSLFDHFARWHDLKNYWQSLIDQYCRSQ